jgi:type II secretory pathway pseudopilin PulG
MPRHTRHNRDSRKNNRKGMSLVEIMVVMGLMALLIPSLLTAVVASREGTPQRENRLEATNLLKEAEEAVRSVRNEDWNDIGTNGTFHPQDGGSYWELASGSEVLGLFTRQVVIADVQRDENMAVVASGGTVDPSTKKITTTVSWTQPIPASVQSIMYLARHLGNTTSSDTTEAHFDAGTQNNSRTQTDGDGMVELHPGQGTLSFTDDYNDSADYNFDSDKIEVTAGIVQLKNQAGSGTNTTSNSGFDAGTSGWSFGSYGNNVRQAGVYQPSSGNPGGYAQVDFPKKKKNKVAGGYWYQAFTVNDSDSPATLTFDWKVDEYQASPDDFYLYASIDTGTGTPGTIVWNSGTMVGTTPWASVNLDVSSYISTPGTYYLKVGSYVDYPGSKKKPYSVGFDNVSLEWTDTEESYASDEPSIYSDTSFEPASVISWDGFSEVATENGGSIMYQLSDDDGSTWYYYTTGPVKWTEATQSDHYTDASTVNIHISFFPITSGKIMVRSFLIGDGTQQVQLDSTTVEYSGESADNEGTFVSRTHDAGSEVSFNNITWTENSTANTFTGFQVASSNDDISWTFTGPDGTAVTYFTDGSATIPLDKVQARYFRYKIYFTSSTNDLPSVEEVTINYAP